MERPESKYVVYEHHLLGNLSEPTGSGEERTLHKALKPRQVSQSSTSELSLMCFQMWMIALGGLTLSDDFWSTK